MSFITSGRAGRSKRNKYIQRVDSNDNIFNLQTYAGELERFSKGNTAGNPLIAKTMFTLKMQPLFLKHP